MPTTHTVQQGESLSKIARQHEISNWKDIYYAPDNEDFRSLRPNPDLLYPGDVLVIPDVAPQTVSLSTERRHRLRIKRNTQTLEIRFLTARRESARNIRVEARLSGSCRDLEPDPQGIITIDIPPSDRSELLLSVYRPPEAEEPVCEYRVQPNHLDPVDTTSGIQARLNALGFPAGPVDDLMGSKTRAGVEAFQRSHPELVEDGIPGPKTQATLEDAYGC